MNERNYGRVVLAEDEPDRALEMMNLLEKIGSFDVRTTRRKRDLLGLLEETQAGWLLLDLNLEDGNSADLVPEIRNIYGNEVFIIVLSGYFEEYPEYELLAMGVDLYLRKPYSARAMLMQMEKLKERVEGREVVQRTVRKLKIGKGSVDLERGTYDKGDKLVEVPTRPLDLIRILSSSFSDDGWEYVNKINIIGNIWGEEYKNDPELLGQRLRRIRSDAKRFFGIDVIEGDRKYSSSAFRLSRDVELLD
jgi:DNA-binding response OmpR family regulator